MRASLLSRIAATASCCLSCEPVANSWSNLVSPSASRTRAASSASPRRSIGHARTPSQAQVEGLGKERLALLEPALLDGQPAELHPRPGVEPASAGRHCPPRRRGEIAQQLFLSHGTAKTHVTRILAKLRLRDRVQAIVLACERGLVTPGE